MQFHPEFWAPFVVLTIAVVYFEWRFKMLRDQSSVSPQPYSWSRVQLAWWTIIILSAFVGLMLKYGEAPTLRDSTLILLGISGATITAARLTDVSDLSSGGGQRHQDHPSQNFFLDILSDANGVSIHRFQAFVFNLGFGIWFIHGVLKNFATGEVNGQVVMDKVNVIIPNIEPNNLVLLGLSSGTYAILKMTENKATVRTAQPVQNATPSTAFVDEAIEPAVG